MSLKICIPAIAAFLLVACGGDDNKASDPDPSAEADFVVDSFDNLSVCTDKREGATAYVKGEDNDYICTNGGWTIDTNADTRKKSSSSKDKAKSSSSRCEDCKDEAISSSSLAKSSSSKQSSSSIASMTPCKTETEDNCVYGVLVDSRDGQTYKTVKIGGWWWMAENLNYEVDSSFCYHDSVEYCEKYGRLYQWAAAVGRFEWECGYRQTCEIPDNARGVCPEGWHLPDTTDWNTLLTDVGGKSTASVMLKSQTGWDINGTDAYGFSALPAGYRLGATYPQDDKYSYEGTATEIWSANEIDVSNAYYIELRNGVKSADIPKSGINKSIARSVRCIKDYLVSERFAARCKTESEDHCEYGELKDDRDGQTYKTVKIGDQWWMAENLNYEVDSSFCFNDSAEYCEKYGRLYKWAAAVDKSEEECGSGKKCGLSGKVRGVCPEGWRLPYYGEWKTLLSEVGGKSNAGAILRSQTGWNRVAVNGVDSYGFSVLPAGDKNKDGDFIDGDNAYFWSASEDDNNVAYYLHLNFSNAILHHYSKDYAFSVRCLQDDLSSEQSSSLEIACKTETGDNCEYGELKDDRDGQTYKTVKIGDQWWMAENLNYKVDSSFCFNDSAEYCEKYGRLYQWVAAVGKSEEECGYGNYCRFSGMVRGVCPKGWHLPREVEWKTLSTKVGGRSKTLKSQTGWDDYNGSGNGTDSYGFSAFPVGSREPDGDFIENGIRTYFWDGEGNSDFGGSMLLVYSGESVYIDTQLKGYALSVRCIQD